jgi:serine/threonine protein kinase/tetratricopeptide (TPR) repeat protein
MKKMMGKTISHYEITDVLGSGAMSTVYKAKDLRLERNVALKFLSPQLSIDENEKDRLIQEAKTTSTLEHPNICTIYEIDEIEGDLPGGQAGQVFIAMAYYEGETLEDRITKGAMSIEEAVGLMTQINQGVSKAHEKGIIHRDLKPANIMITDDGVVKILDFGIAKLLYQKSKTKSGIIMGTPGYLAPEQAKGEKIGPHTDIWALGIIFYEMLCGELPFSGDTDIALIYSIVNNDPFPITRFVEDIPASLEQIIQKMIQKNSEDRYQKVEEIMRDLTNLMENKQEAGTIRLDAAEINLDVSPSIAVLPFLDMSPEKDQEYFCDGLTEEIISTLSRVEGLRVVSRMSSFQYKGKEFDLRQVGQQLNVRTILEGSIRKAGNKVRISVQLTNVLDGFLLWTEKFEREIKDIFEIQDEIAQAIVKALKIKLISKKDEKIYKNYTKNVEAYSDYLRGRYHWNKRTSDALKKSIDHFNLAIEKDPQYALAFAGLADAYIILGLYGALPPKFVMPKAKAAAQKALEIDQELPEAHTSLGCIKSVFDWDWEGAEKDFKQGIDLNPNYALAHHWYAINYLTSMGRFKEAVEEMKKALDLDPISLVINTTVGLVHYFAQEYEKAKDIFLQTLEVESNFAMAHFFLGQTYTQKKEYDKALAEFEEANQLFGGSTNMLATYGTTEALAGKKGDATSMLESLLSTSKEEYVSAYDIAMIYTGLGDIDEAFNWLQKAVEEHSYLLIYLNVDPILDPLRSDKRFNTIQKKLSLLKES